MSRPAPDVEAFRSALAREVARVSPRPGGWERVRASLARPPSRRRPRWLDWLPLAAPLVAAGLVACALATAGLASTRAAAAGPFAAPPILSVYGAMVAVAAPLSLADGRRPTGPRDRVRAVLLA